MNAAIACAPVMTLFEQKKNPSCNHFGALRLMWLESSARSWNLSWFFRPDFRLILGAVVGFFSLEYNRIDRKYFLELLDFFGFPIDFDVIDEIFRTFSELLLCLGLFEIQYLLTIWAFSEIFSVCLDFRKFPLLQFSKKPTFDGTNAGASSNT